jgi:hypothetical protein
VTKVSSKKSLSDAVIRQWKVSGVPPLKKHGMLLKKGICLLEKARPSLRSSPLVLPEQPFDLHLLHWSRLYQQSRKLFKEGHGSFLGTLVSSPRSLSSPILLEPRVEYSPIEKELVWSATNPSESKNLDRLLMLRTYVSSLFHEQNHRILWNHLPSAPSDPNELRRYLNFAESLVIVTDMALGDELGPKLASLFYLTGATYDPGTSVRLELQDRRMYRNYLQAALHSTFLILELYDPADVLQAIPNLFPMLGGYAKRAVIRSGNLDASFIQNTNLKWQTNNANLLRKVLCKKAKKVLSIAEDPFDFREPYLIAEKWFDLFHL